MFEVAGVDRINSAEDHRMNFLKSGQWLARRVALIGNGVADFHVGGAFDVGDEITDITRFQSRLYEHLRREHAHFLDLVARIVAHQFNRVICLHRSRNNAHVTNHAAVNIEHRIKHKSAQCLVRRFLRRWNSLHNRFQNFLDANSHFRAGFDRFLGRDGENLFQLPMDGGHIRIWKIDFVNDRHDREALFVREMHVRYGLRLNPLGCVHNQQCPFARRQTSRNFVGKIDMPWRVEQVQPIRFA